ACISATCRLAPLTQSPSCALPRRQPEYPVPARAPARTRLDSSVQSCKSHHLPASTPCPGADRESASQATDRAVPYPPYFDAALPEASREIRSPPGLSLRLLSIA